MDLIDGTLAEFAENDLKELWDSDYYAEAVKAAGMFSWSNKEALRAASELDWAGMLESSGVGGAAGVVLNDRLMTEASLGVISQLSSLGTLGTLGSLGPLSSLLAAHQQEASSPTVKVEHSYSLADRGDAESPLSDLESECFPAIPISEAEGGTSSSSSTSSSTTTTTTTIASTTTTPSNKMPITTILYDGEKGAVISNPSNSITSQQTSLGASPTAAATTASATAAAAAAAAATTAANTSFRKMLDLPPLSPLPLEASSSTEDLNHIDTSSVPNLLSNTVLNVPSIKTSMGLVRPSAVVVTQRTNLPGGLSSSTSRPGLSSLTLRLPSSSFSSAASSSSSSSSSITTSGSSSDSGFYMPPTPPSCSSSDSECGGQSPTRDRTPPLYETLTPQFANPRKSNSRIMVSSRHPINTPLISTQPKGATGAINLTEEEKRTLLSEGYSIPSRLPLTKTEEKSLKKIRRKIKNKISAQESRRKKKEYMDALERKVEKLSTENGEYKRRIDLLQTSNSQLMLELQRLQTIVEHDEKNRIRSANIATLLS